MYRPGFGCGVLGEARDNISAAVTNQQTSWTGVRIPRHPTVQEMIDMTERHKKVEFAVVYTYGKGKNGGGGYYTLYSGGINHVYTGNPSATNMLIWHTHPKGSTIASSEYVEVAGKHVLDSGDLRVLQNYQNEGSPQKSSVVIPLKKEGYDERFPPFRFSVDNDNLDYHVVDRKLKWEEGRSAEERGTIR